MTTTKKSVVIILLWSLLTISLLLCWVLLQWYNPEYTVEAVGSLTQAHQKCACPSYLPPNTTVVRLSPPQRPFHSNHWFHIAEYYLANHHYFLNLKSSGIIIVSCDSKFVHLLTKSAFFFLVMMLPIQQSEWVMVVPPSYFEHCDQRGQLISPPKYTKDNFDEKVWMLRKNQSKYTSLQIRSSSLENFRFQPLCSPTEIAVGSTPINSSKWFYSYAEVESFRSKIAQVCGSHSINGLTQSTMLQKWNYSTSREGSYGTKRGVQSDIRINIHDNYVHDLPTTKLSKHAVFKLVVYQRDSNRRFQDLHNILQKIMTEISFPQSLNREAPGSESGSGSGLGSESGSDIGHESTSMIKFPQWSRSPAANKINITSSGLYQTNSVLLGTEEKTSDSQALPRSLPSTASASASAMAPRWRVEVSRWLKVLSAPSTFHSCIF